MTLDEKLDQELVASNIIPDDIREALALGEKKHLEHGYQRICDVLNKLEPSKDQATEAMLSEEQAM